MKWSNQCQFFHYLLNQYSSSIYNIDFNDTTTEHCNTNETFSFRQMKLRLSPLNLQKL